jgi:hypothetical protein
VSLIIPGGISEVGVEAAEALSLKTVDDIQAYMSRRLEEAFVGRTVSEVGAEEVLEYVLRMRKYLEQLGVIPPLDASLEVVVDFDSANPGALSIGVRRKE